MDIFTIGYGGRKPADFVELLRANRVRTVVDVRAVPSRSAMGAYVKARSPTQGIEARLHAAGIGYSWLEMLGNPFRGTADWRPLYVEHLRGLPRIWIAEIARLDGPACLMCAEKRPEDCHRSEIARVLEADGHSITNIV